MTAGPALPPPAVPSLAPPTAEDLAGALRAAREAGRTVLVRGRGTRAAPLAAPGAPRAAAARGAGGGPRGGPDLVLSTSALTEVLAYEPGDLTVTVQAGLRTDRLDALLAEHGQMLPLHGRRGDGTVGGLLATAADGACDLLYGTPRDRLVGAAVALPDGTLARGRGRVVKNVAGYDLPRLLTGSHGTLGAIVEASFKLQPRPAAQATLTARFDGIARAFEAVAHLRTEPLEPAFLDVLWRDRGDGAPRRGGEAHGGGGEAARAASAGSAADEPGATVAVGFDGSETRVAGQLARARSRLAVGAAEVLVLHGAADERLREQLEAQSGDVVLRLATLPSLVRAQCIVTTRAARAAGVAVSVDARPWCGIAYLALHGEPGALAAALRACLPPARRDGCHAVVTRAPALPPAALSSAAIWGPPPPDLALMERIKLALDPDGVLAAGRFMGDL